jgi:hypothetical protein
MHETHEGGCEFRPATLGPRPRPLHDD